MNPIEALDACVTRALIDSMRRKPGEIIAHMPQSVRDQLVHLTSDDALNLRADWIPLPERRS